MLGLDEPVQEYTGIIIAIIHRDDDVEEKWVVAPEGTLRNVGSNSNFDKIFLFC